MLQRTEYDTGVYLKWYKRVENFNKISKRGELVVTKKSKLLLYLINIMAVVLIIISLTALIYGFYIPDLILIWFGLILVILYPIILAYMITVPMLVAKIFIVKPKEKQLIKQSKGIFNKTNAIKIAVAGSYGKTTMKELLKTVLSESGLVAATSGNKNVASSHAYFAHKLTGDEKYIIVEFGEGQPGDVERFTETVKPDIAVITGIAPAHLDKYPTVEIAANDIFSLTNSLHPEKVYINSESDYIKSHLKLNNNLYSESGVGKWKVSKVIVNFSGIAFDLTNGSKIIRVRSKLLGRHQIGPLTAVAIIAYDLGCDISKIEKGLANTEAYEHRMQLRKIGDAYLIDDTYNGNVNGIKAGLDLLGDLRANRKIYVTPGLVDQGIETMPVHNKIGKMIAIANPDKVILMNNSVTKYIVDGLGNYKGELIIENNPLEFYTNIDKFVANGDLVLMQNDWPDNYN
jgi:UDP-N-acetylmuramoyl-tripeptide--D-alanyl-D-alanine ligase